MPIVKFAKYTPQLGDNIYIAPGAWVIGNVEMGANSSLWFNSIARGDCNKITIGENTNIQDLCMLHITEASPLIIGSNVSVGHSVTLHGCTVKDGCLIGMGSTILDDAIIGENCVVAAGSLVPPRKEYPAGSMIMGNPAKVVRQLTEKEAKFAANHFQSYLGYKEQFQNDFSYNQDLKEQGLVKL